MKGIYTALVTPFKSDLSIDFDAFERLLKQQIRSQVDGVVISGTTGESPTLTQEEKLDLVRKAKAVLDPARIEVVVGTGSNDTSETIDFTLEVEKLGVKRFLLVTPYYNKPSQNGLLKHFQSVGDRIQGEIVLYNVPTRTGVSLSAKTIAELAGHPRIRALKEATGDLTFLSEVVDQLRRAKREIALLSGDDATYFPFLCAGGQGVISVASHLIAKPMKEIHRLIEAGDIKKAREIHQRCYPIFRDIFVDTNPVPMKYCLSEGQLMLPHVRPPLVETNLENKRVLRVALEGWKWNQGMLE